MFFILIFVRRLTYNVLELNFSLGFATLSTEILLTKLNVYWAFAKAVAPRKTIIFALQMSNKHLALSVIFRLTKFQNPI